MNHRWSKTQKGLILGEWEKEQNTQIRYQESSNSKKMLPTQGPREQAEVIKHQLPLKEKSLLKIQVVEECSDYQR